MNAAERDVIPDSVRFAPHDDLWAWGRNGQVASSGIDVCLWGGDRVIALRNINSKGDISDAARLVLPVTAIPELVAILQRIYAGPLGRLALDVTEPSITTVGDNQP
jgi:hypothetical protein